VKRRPHWLMRGSVVASHVLSAIVAGLWIHSLGRIDHTEWNGHRANLQFEDADGVADACLTDDTTPISPAGWFYDTSLMPAGSHFYDLEDPDCNHWGFGLFLIRTVGPPQGNWHFGQRPLIIAYAPYWFLELPLLVLPCIAAFGLIRSRRRLRTGCCGQCGYDLRATPGRCPECGATSPTK
jgi:hypothetical protein